MVWEAFAARPDPEGLWRFWTEWYRGMLDGQPMDWELQFRVTLIDLGIWNAGPEAVVERIEEIRARYSLETQSKEMEEAAYVTETYSCGIGDNHPPSPIDDDVPDFPPITIIWAAAHELHETTQSGEPDIGLIRRAIGLLAGGLKSCGLWAWGKLDKGLTAVVVSIGAAAGPTAGVCVTQNSDKIKELMDSAQKLLRFLP